MESCICCHCAKRINKGEKVFWMENSKNNILKPTCSEDCANNYKKFIINKLKEKIKRVEMQEIEEDIL